MNRIYTCETDHLSDIQFNARKFMVKWMRQEITDEFWDMTDPFIREDESTISRADVASCIQYFFSVSGTFTKTKFNLEDVQFQVDEELGIGTAVASGSIRFDIKPDPREDRKRFEGQFRLYFIFEDPCWRIYNIVIPGLKL